MNGNPMAATGPAAPDPGSARGIPAWMLAMGLFLMTVGVANGILVWLSSRGHRDLVRADYYEAGLKQDSVIALAAAAGSVSLRRESGAWLLENAAGAVAATGCRLRLYRPDDESADRELRLEREPAAAGRERWRAPAPALRRGHWIATAVWERGGSVVREASLELREP